MKWLEHVVAVVIVVVVVTLGRTLASCERCKIDIPRLFTEMSRILNSGSSLYRRFTDSSVGGSGAVVVVVVVVVMVVVHRSLYVTCSYAVCLPRVQCNAIQCVVVSCSVCGVVLSCPACSLTYSSSSISGEAGNNRTTIGRTCMVRWAAS